MTLHGLALRVTVLIGDADQAHHRLLYSEIVHRAWASGLAGAGVLRGLEGGSAVPAGPHLSAVVAASDLPIAVFLVDTEEKIREFLPELEELVGRHGGLVMLDEDQVVTYAAKPTPDES